MDENISVSVHLFETHNRDEDKRKISQGRKRSPNIDQRMKISKHLCNL